jgi:hypothetical protein
VLKRDLVPDPLQCSEFCVGTNATSNGNVYVCGDPRLGPWKIPTALLLTAIAGTESNYHRFAGLCPGEFLAKFTSPATGQYVYPPFNGFQSSASNQSIEADMVLNPGTLLDRFGSEYGTVLGAAGAPYSTMPNDHIPSTVTCTR